MKLPDDLPLYIQCFVYFLFKGALTPQLYVAENDYLPSLLQSPTELERVFALFAHDLRTGREGWQGLADDYLMARHARPDEARAAALLAQLPVDPPSDVYAHFLELARCFVHNTFTDPIRHPRYLLDLEGCGTDAVRVFALWTNVVMQTAGPSTEPDYPAALRRANERARHYFDGQLPVIPFTDAELDQEIW